MSFGIYVHWPFCAAKCPYCDFNSHVRVAVDEEGWVDGILSELDWNARQQGNDRPVVETVFFGGGTPSLMSGASTGRILDKIARNWRMATDVEITLEANPASVEAARFADYRTAGVNRVSLGVQALNDKDLKTLGRLHDAAEAKAALATAMKIFSRVSLDLIYARPDQSVEEWRAELREALSFGTGHLSLYQLTIEPGTAYAVLYKSGALHIPDDDLAVALYEETQEMTEAAGLPAYEISNHACAGQEARHNLLYWHYGEYAGVGPGAHGRLMLDGSRIATAAEKLPERWRKNVLEHGHGLAERNAIENDDAAREHILMNLRLRAGIDLDDYRARWGAAPSMEKISTLAEQGLVTLEGAHLSATPKGRLVLNSVIAALV